MGKSEKSPVTKDTNINKKVEIFDGGLEGTNGIIVETNPPKVTISILPNGYLVIVNFSQILVLPK